MAKSGWPLLAFLAWGACWLVHQVALNLGLSGVWSIAAGTAMGVLFCGLTRTLVRRMVIVLGFPLSYLLTSATWDIPLWAWFTLFVLAILIYPRRAWVDAPVFPTPRRALSGLQESLNIPGTFRVLDAGCGFGDGLIALRHAFPQAELRGVEISWLLSLICAIRCPWATIRRGDIWCSSWAQFDMVYLFQRPETMPRAIEKARAELRPGAFLVSLEFAVPGLQPHLNFASPSGRRVWVYRAPFEFC